MMQVILTYVVYEKQHRLKIMMKMHGLKDGPYWIISYAYFFVLSAFYMLCFVIFGSVIGKIIDCWPSCLEPHLTRDSLSLSLARLKILHIECLQHTVCVLFHLHEPADCTSLSRFSVLFRCKDCYRYELLEKNRAYLIDSMLNRCV